MGHTVIKDPRFWWAQITVLLLHLSTLIPGASYYSAICWVGAGWMLYMTVKKG